MKQNYCLYFPCFRKEIPKEGIASDSEIALEEIDVAAILYSTSSMKETIRVLRKKGLGEIVKKAFNPCYRSN